uniref:Proteinase inhibitor type-2 CEVI57 n=1 Tax=Solanum tuberosum TaxID=4113 RepID=M0ZZR7_SOLTU
MGYAHVQKEVRKIPYAPTVVQVIKVAIIIVLMGLSFAKDNLTQKTQKLAPEIVIHILPIQNVPVQEERH